MPLPSGINWNIGPVGPGRGRAIGYHCQVVSTETQAPKLRSGTCSWLDATAKWYQLKLINHHCSLLSKALIGCHCKVVSTETEDRVIFPAVKIDWMPLPSGINWNFSATFSVTKYVWDWMPLPSGINWNTKPGMVSLLLVDWMPLPSGINWNFISFMLLWFSRDWMPLPSGINCNFLNDYGILE